MSSARIFDVADDEILHAYGLIRVFQRDHMTVLIGADATGGLLEIGVTRHDQMDFIVHACPAPSGEHLLRRAAVFRVRAEPEMSDAVAEARREGLSWQQIGRFAGMSTSAARQLYGP